METQAHDSADTEQLHTKINAERKRLKTNNIVSAVLFVALGMGIYYLASSITGFIAGAGRANGVPTREVIEAAGPYKSVQISSITFVIAGMVAYINLMIGNIKAGIYIIPVSMVAVAILLYLMDKNLGKDELYSIAISMVALAPLLIVALNTLRVNYFGNKRIKNMAAGPR